MKYTAQIYLKAQRSKRHPTRGQALLGVLAFVLVTSVILAGVAALTVSDYNSASLGSDYDTAIFSAQAGINYELNKISQNNANADQSKGGTTPGTTYVTPAGTFTVYVAQRNSDGTEQYPWSVGKDMWVYATGTSGKVSRTIKVAAVGYGTGFSGNYAAFGVYSGLIKGTPTVVQGDIGTNGTMSFTGNPTVTGSIVFNGPGSGWSSLPNLTYTTAYNSLAMQWPTVEAIAVANFGSTGLSYVAVHNDNALASPVISNNSVSINGGVQTFYGKSGGANYYLTNLTCKGGATIYFDNRNGPITIWIGPSGGNGDCSFAGGTAAIKMSQDPSKPARMFVALNSDVNQSGNVEFDGGIYNVNATGAGTVIINGQPVMYASIIANHFKFNGNPLITYTGGYFTYNGVAYYGAVTPYQEVGGYY